VSGHGGLQHRIGLSAARTAWLWCYVMQASCCFAGEAPHFPPHKLGGQPLGGGLTETDTHVMEAMCMGSCAAWHSCKVHMIFLRAIRSYTIFSAVKTPGNRGDGLVRTFLSGAVPNRGLKCHVSAPFNSIII
jgi:hypothetical protein